MQNGSIYCFIQLHLELFRTRPWYS